MHDLLLMPCTALEVSHANDRKFARPCLASESTAGLKPTATTRLNEKTIKAVVLSMCTSDPMLKRLSRLSQTALA